MEIDNWRGHGGVYRGVEKGAWRGVQSDVQSGIQRGVWSNTLRGVQMGVCVKTAVFYRPPET